MSGNHRARIDRVRTALAPLAGSVARTPPPALRERILHAAGASRSPGHGVQPDVVGAVRAYTRRLDAFADVLGAVRDWAAPTDVGWDAHETLAHAVEVERYFGSVLGLWPYEVQGPEFDHRAMTDIAVRTAHDVDPAMLLATWHRTTAQIRSHLERAPLPATLRFHTLDMTTPSCLALRAFELWTHGDDLRRAIGLEPDPPAPQDMVLLADTAVHLVPLGMAMRGVRRVDDTVRFVLTGPGGGTWIAPLSSGAPADPTLTLVADVVAFCRVAAKRIPVDDLDIEICGEPDLAREVLVGASAFAA